MAKKKTHISVRNFEKMMVDNNCITNVDELPDVDICVNYTIPLVSALQFVEDVVSACIDTERGEYIPEAKRFAIRKCVLTLYGDFTMPVDIEKQYELVYRTEAYHAVMSVLNMDQYMDIIEAIEDRIEHELAIMENGMTEKLNDIARNLGEMTERSKEVFGNVDPEELGAFVESISSMGGVDEGKLVDAIMAARGKSKDNIVMLSDRE